jgi:hypothetical protein
MMIGWEIYIAFFADTSLPLSVYCAVVSYKTFVLSARESIPICLCWHTHAVFHVLRLVLLPLISQTFQYVPAMCWSPLKRALKGHTFRVEKVVKATAVHGFQQWPMEFFGVLLGPSFLTVVFCLEYRAMNKLHTVSNTTHKRRCSNKEQHCNVSPAE